MTFDPSQASHGNVKVIPTTVVKGNGDGFVFFQREVALVMSRTAVLARKVAVIAYLSQFPVAVDDSPSAYPTVITMGLGSAYFFPISIS